MEPLSYIEKKSVLTLITLTLLGTQTQVCSFRAPVQPRQRSSIPIRRFTDRPRPQFLHPFAHESHYHPFAKYFIGNFQIPNFLQSLQVDFNVSDNGIQTESNVSSNISKNGPKVSEFLVTADENLAFCGPKHINIRELTVDRAKMLFEGRHLTSLRLTRCYLQRIRVMDKFLKSVIEVNPEAIEHAIRSDILRTLGIKSGKSPLNGIPVLLKDNIATGDKMLTTAGSFALEKCRVQGDAAVVSRLRNAGAVILGKTNPSEWSQSAVAMSANLGLLSLGTETDGSILSPSSLNGLVGLKPTLGIVPSQGVIPISHLQDVVGPMTRSVSDAVHVMSVISDVDLHGCEFGIETCFWNETLTIGIVRDHFWLTPDPFLLGTYQVMERRLRFLNATRKINFIDDIPVTSTAFGEFSDLELIALAHEFKFALNKYLRTDVIECRSSLGTPIRSLEDIIAFNEVHPVENKFPQETLKLSQSTDGLRNATYRHARKSVVKNSRQFLNAVFEFGPGVDAIAAPCFSTELYLYSVGDAAGYPSISVPMGVAPADNLPYGLCLTGKEGSEAVLLKLAYLLETTRPQPLFMSKVED